MSGRGRTPPPLVSAAATTLALAALSLALPSGPTYDPYAWLIWGRDIAHLGPTSTGGGTSWKPLPSFVDVLLTPLGAAAADGWIVIARAGALFAVFMAFRLVWRLTPRGTRLPAALIATASLALTHKWFENNGVGGAEGLMVAFGLLAIDRHLDGHRGQAFALLIAAALIRVEMSPFAAAYGAWLAWHGDARRRIAVASGLLVIPLLWLGGDWVASGRMTSGSDHALKPIPGTPGASTHPAVAVIEEALSMLPSGAWVAIVVGLLLATLELRPGRIRMTPLVALTALAVAWTAIVAVMAERGYAGEARFIFMASALEAVAAGIAVGELASRLRLPGIARRSRGAMPVPAGRPARAAATAAASLACLAFAFAAVPYARLLPHDAAAIDHIADLDAALARSVKNAGGAQAVTNCGDATAPWYTVTAIAWDLGVPAQEVHDRPEGARPVVFKQRRGSWRVLEASRCRLLAAKAS